MICDNLTHILDMIEQTARNVGRNPKEIKLVAVSKGMSVEQVQLAIDCGQDLFGESYLQEASSKIRHFPTTVRWHFIGHLQSNKARQAAELFDVIETVDRLNLAQALDNHVGLLKKELSILVQVNLGREKQKSGILPEEAEPFLRLITQKTRLHILGLMTIPPYFPDPEKSRTYFKELNDLARKLADQGLFKDNAHPELSMGMSNDYAVAIEEGATIVRVGTALFGTRNQKGISL